MSDGVNVSRGTDGMYSMMIHGWRPLNVDGLNMDDFYQRAVSSDEEDFVVSEVGSITDFYWDMSEEEEFDEFGRWVRCGL